MFDKDITIINKYDDNGSLKYKCTNVKGFWSSSKGISINGVDLIETPSVTVRILMSENGYVNPNSYNGTGWTLRNDDYIVKGIITAVTSISSLLSSNETIKISNVAIKDYGSKEMHHYEVSG